MQNKKKLLIGSLSVSAVVAGVALTGGTSAYYYNLETSEGNSFEACSLDLRRHAVQVAWEGTGSEQQADVAITPDLSDPQSANHSFQISNMQPGDAYAITMQVNNFGDCEGDLWFDVDFPISDMENGFTDAETEAGDTSDDRPGPIAPASPPGGGELDDTMQVVYQDDGGSSDQQSYNQLAYRAPDMVGVLAAQGQSGDSETVVLHVSIPEGDRGEHNDIMTDSFTFDVHFALAQLGKFTGGDLNDS